MSTTINSKELSGINLPFTLENAILVINKRIARHEEKILQSQQCIIDNIDFPNIVNAEIASINERLAKIEEAREIMEYGLIVKS